MRNHSYENEFHLYVHSHANQTHFHFNGFARRLFLKMRQRTTRKWPIQSMLNVCTEEKICSYPVPCSFRTWLILTAYIICPSRGKGVSSSNSSVLHLRASSMMHCGHRFKNRNFCLLVVSSTEFGKVTLKVLPLPPPLVAVDAVSYILRAFCPGSRGYPPIT